VFPLFSEGARAGTPRLKGWPERATTSAATVETWWTKWPDAWIGIATGPGSDLLVIDLDVKGDKDGVASWEALSPDDGTGVMATTPNGGWHLYYHTTEHYGNSVGKLGEGIDVRGARGFVVAPPAPGREWAYTPDTSPADVPTWLAELLKPETPAERHDATSHLAELLQDPPGADVVGWNDWLVRVAGHYAKLIPYEDAYTTLVQKAAELCDGSWKTGEVEKVADSAWRTEHAKAEPPEGVPPLAYDELMRLRAREWAKEAYRNEQIQHVTPPPITLWSHELEQEDEDLPWTVADLHVTGGNTLLAAQYKTGKTSFVLNVAHSLIDQVPFLDVYPTTFAEGTVVYANYELTDRQFRKWLRRIDPKNPQRALVWNLRGYTLPFWERDTKELIVRTLAEAKCQALILDPWAKVFNGAGDENSNSDVGKALDTWDEIKRLADIPDLFLVAHTGRKEFGDTREVHVRAATRLDDWADSRWLLSKDAQNVRWFTADGRDVNTGEAYRLQWDSNAHRITADVAATKKASAMSDRLEQIRRLVATGASVTKTNILDCLRGSADSKRQAIDEAVRCGILVADGNRYSAGELAA
jgi:hypothetical protein